MKQFAEVESISHNQTITKWGYYVFIKEKVKSFQYYSITLKSNESSFNLNVPEMSPDVIGVVTDLKCDHRTVGHFFFCQIKRASLIRAVNKIKLIKQGKMGI